MSTLSQTPVKLDALGLLRLQEPVLTMGSCFAEHMGERLSRNKWRCLNNPFGTLFHPLTICRLLTMALRQEELDQAGFLTADGACFHFDLPSTFYGRDPADLQSRFRQTADQLAHFIKAQPLWILLTLGTAYVYEHKKTGELVANCHRQAADTYRKRLLSFEEQDRAWEQLQALLPAHVRLLWTLSPVRHTRETLPLNMVSKSLLRVWIHQWLEKHGERNFYFPAYEILLDELRDYRYYAADLIHPSETAVNEIWQRFQYQFMDRASQDFIDHWSRIRQRLEHRPMRPEAPSYREFLVDTLRLLDEIIGVDVQAERDLLRRRLTEISPSTWS